MNTPFVSFLGITNKISKHRNDNTKIDSYSLLGLSNTIISQIYPLSLGNFSILISLHVESIKSPFKISGFSQKQGEIINIKFDSFQKMNLQNSKIPEFALNQENFYTYNYNPWILIPIKISQEVILNEPDLLSIKVITDDFSEFFIGSINFLFQQTPPLTQDRVAALKSNPNSIKELKMELGYKLCGSKLTIYSGLEKFGVGENEYWYSDLPERYSCNCNKTIFNLFYIKNGLHSLLMNEIGDSSSICSSINQYEKNALISIYYSFKDLIDRDVNEEIIQKYLEQNPILFFFFSASRIINKAPIFQKFKTDFLILSRTGVLYFIEIEKSSKSILKSDGGRTSDFNHAFDQVNDWLTVYNDHKQAVLDSLDIKSSEVTKAKGVVFFGREEGLNAKDLRKIKSIDFGSVEFYTYDDLLHSFNSMIVGFEKI